MPDNETSVGNAYNRAEVEDIPEWINAYPSGTPIMAQLGGLGEVSPVAA